MNLFKLKFYNRFIKQLWAFKYLAVADLRKKYSSYFLLVVYYAENWNR